ncbi:MAG TPA: MarR family transcriptional regulator [Mycobacteriales bacterium]|jgi:Transcriptional regulators
MNERDRAGVEAWRAMLLAYNAAMRAIDAELERTGSIPLTWYDVLLELNAAPGRKLRMQDLAGRVVLSRSRVSRLVDDMVRAGLVSRTRGEVDRREVWASITERGREDLRATAPRYLSGIERHFSSHLSDEEKVVVAVALTKVTAAHSPGGCTPEPMEARPPGRRGATG